MTVHRWKAAMKSVVRLVRLSADDGDEPRCQFRGDALEVLQAAETLRVWRLSSLGRLSDVSDLNDEATRVAAATAPRWATIDDFVPIVIAGLLSIIP